MTETEEVTEVTERRTFLTGKFKGKFMGELNLAKSDLNHERFYDLEVLEGEVFTQRAQIKKWQDGDEEKPFADTEPFPSKLPEKLRCQVLYEDGSFKWFTIELHEPKLLNYKLFNQHYEGETLYGTIEGDISGYLLHFDVSTVTRAKVSIPETIHEQQSERFIEPELTNVAAGENERYSNYVRKPVYDKKGNFAYTKWEYNASTNKTGFWNLLSLFIQWLVFPLLLLPLLLFGWRLFVPLAIFAGVLYFLSAITPLIRIILGWTFRLVSFVLAFLFIGSIFNLINVKREHAVKSKAKNDVSEKTTTRKPKGFKNDSIISHYRIWKDYNEREYRGNLEVLGSCVGLATDFRNGNSNRIINTSEYSMLLSTLETFDKPGLGRIYNLFDSIRKKEKLTDLAFAEVMVSCIQDIPYTMLLDNDCNPKLYDDAYIKKYLRNGGDCEGHVKYGLYGPIEFMGNLKGDCDTRSLLLFSILDHYGYDAAILASDVYKHAVIAVNLPYEGVYKLANGKRYTVWETTAKGIRPGMFPPEIADMRHWEVVLLTQINQLL